MPCALTRTLRHCYTSRAGLAGLLTIQFAMRAAEAACLGALTQASPPNLEQLTMAAPVAALKIIELQLAPERAASLSLEQRGALWAMAAEAYRQLSLSEAELQAANAGLALRLPSTSPVALRLHAIHALALDDHGTMRDGIAELDRVLVDRPNDALAAACLRRERGWLRRSAGDTEGALSDLSFAREQLSQRGMTAEAMIATGRLAAVYASAGEIDAAIALLRETVDYFTSLQAWIRVATARQRLGDALLVRRDFDAARKQFREMQQFSERAGDVLGVAYADLRTCASFIDEGKLQTAEGWCNLGATIARQVGPTDVSDSHLLNLLLGRIALGRHDWHNAERYFSAALVDADDVLNPELAAQLYNWRGEARAALGHPAQAYADAREHANRLRAVTDSSSARRIALLRVRFATDREIANNNRLRQDRASLLGQANSERGLRNSIIVVAVLAVLSFALGMLAVQRRRIAETAQQESTHRIEELGRLTAGIAHEFNNLLTVVQQSVGLLRRRLAASADSQSLALLDTAGEAAATGGAVTQQLLAFGLQQTLQPNAIAVHDFIVTVLPQLQIAAGAGLTLRSELDPDATTLTADPRQLTSALLNLILNARDATSGSGTVMLRSQLVTEGPGGRPMIALTIEDEGSGMSTAVLERATEPFFTTKQVGSGNGLGLSAVAGFARQSGGTLQIRSDPGRGTAVTLTLPCASPK